MNNLELLAPAGNMDNLKVAVNNGADAVYLGMQNFNARNKAGNFDESNIKDVVDFCHLHNVKVYLTVNTIIKDSEIEDLLDMVKVAVCANVDAYIVQDFGVALLLKNTFENIVLHASTQMGVHNLYGAKVLEEFGFKRVVLSRETTLEDIKQISQNTNLEIEYFVQGALCVAFSGQCYLSSLMHNKSGNRGRCLQLCRLKYRSQLNNSQLKGGYLLSPADLCLIDKLQELKSAGVTSLKIEGRMRREGYVGVVTSEYRKAIDCLESNCSFDAIASKQNIKKVFYRGKCNEGLYLNTKNPNIINPLYQNHRGVQIGKVISVKPFKNINEIIIKSSHNLIQNDGIKCVGKYETSLGVGSVKLVGNNLYSIISSAKPNKDDLVYLTVDKAFEDGVVQKTKKLEIDATFEGKIGKKIKLTFAYKDIKVCEESIVAKEAKTAPITQDLVKEQISKLNDTEFILAGFDSDIDNIFVPKSVINELRRKAIKALENKIIAKYNSDMPKVNFLADKYMKLKKQKAINNSFLAKIINEDVELSDKEVMSYDIIYFPQDYNNVGCAKNLLSEQGSKIYLNLPNVANYKDLGVIKKLLSECKFSGVVVNNLYGLGLAKELGIDVDRIIAGVGMNVANEYSIKFFNSYGINKIMSSIESNLVENPQNVFGGKPTLMTLCHCPYKVNFGGDCSNCHYKKGLKYIQDSGKEFDIRRYRLFNCYFEVISDLRLNGKDIIDLRN